MSLPVEARQALDRFRKYGVVEPTQSWRTAAPWYCSWRLTATTAQGRAKQSETQQCAYSPHGDNQSNQNCRIAKAISRAQAQSGGVEFLQRPYHPSTPASLRDSAIWIEVTHSYFHKIQNRYSLEKSKRSSRQMELDLWPLGRAQCDINHALTLRHQRWRTRFLSWHNC